MLINKAPVTPALRRGLEGCLYYYMTRRRAAGCPRKAGMTSILGFWTPDA